MKKQRKQLIFMIVFLLLLVAGYFGVQKYNEVQANKEAEDTVVYAINLSSSDVTEVSYACEGEEVALVYKDNTWKYREDETLSIMQSRINTMVNRVSKLAIESQIDNVTDVSVYGLTEPKKVITFVAGGNTYKIAIGDFNAVSGLDYVNINDGNVVYAVETTLGDAFDYDLEELVEEEITDSEEDEAMTDEGSDRGMDISD